MAEDRNNVLPDTVLKFMSYWPAALFLLTLIVAGARADTTIVQHTAILQDHGARLAAIEAHLSALDVNMARTAQAAADTQATAHRIERRMDTLPLR